MRRFLLALLLVVLSGALLLGLTHPGRVAVKTAFLLPEVLPGAPVRPLLATTSQPLREEVSYTSAGGVRSATLVRPPGKGPYGAAIFFLGVNPNLEDPDLLRVTEALARSGVVVLLHRSDSLEEVRVTPEEVDALVAAFQFLARQPYVDADRIGFAGFCVGGSLALLAAADPRIRDQVAFVNAFGAYFDLRDVVAAVATRRISYAGVEETWEPQPLAVELLRRGVISALPDPQDRALLAHDFGLMSLSLSPSEEFGPLSPEGLLAYELLETRDPERVQTLLADLPEELRRGLAAVSPSEVVGEIRTKVFLMHDRADALMPYVESRRLRDALQGRTEVHYTEFRLFEHVNPSGFELSFAIAGEVGKLFWHLYQVLLEVV